MRIRTEIISVMQLYLPVLHSQDQFEGAIAQDSLDVHSQFEGAIAQDSLVFHNHIEGGTAQVSLVNLNY